MIKNYKIILENNFIKNLKFYYNKEVNWFHNIIKQLLNDITQICKIEKNILSIKNINILRSFNLFNKKYNIIVLQISNYFNCNWLLLILLLYNQNIIPILLYNEIIEKQFIKTYKQNILFLKQFYKKNKIDTFYFKYIKLNFNPIFRLAYLTNRILAKELIEELYNLNFILNKKDFQLNNSFKKNKKKNIGFISQYLLLPHPVFKDRIGIILNLDKNIFNVFCFVFTNLNKFKKIQKFILKKQIHIQFIKINGYSEKTKNTILSYNLDVLLYCDIGMNMETYFLACNKLAKKQITTFGHSCTSGIKTIDSFISSELFENYNIIDHFYTEKLIKFNNLGMFYYDPFKFLHFTKYDLLKRNQLKISETKIIYVCLHTFLKLNYKFLNTLIKLLLLSKNSELYISLDTNQNNINIKHFKQKIKKYNISNRIKILKRQNFFYYYSYLNIANVIIEPFPFGGLNSTYDVFSLNNPKPIVSLPSKFISGRFTYGILKLLNLNELIAKNENDYINKIIKIGKSKILQNNISNKMKNKKKFIFNTIESINSWNNLFNKI